MSLIIKNQEQVGGSFVRYLAFRSNGIKPVIRNDTNARNREEYGTYQAVNADEWVIRSVVDPTEEQDTVITLLRCQRTSDGLELKPVNETTNLLPMLHITRMYSVLEWLQSYGDVPKLPAGAGWDGENSTQDIVKISNALSIIPNNLRKEKLDEYKSAIPYTPASVYNETMKIIKIDDQEKPALREHQLFADLLIIDGMEIFDRNPEKIVINRNTRVVAVNYKTITVDNGSGEEKQRTATINQLLFV